MKLKFIILGGMTLIILFILGFTAFDFSETVPTINVNLEIVEFEGKPVIIDYSVEQSQTTKMKRPITKLQNFPVVASHAMVNASYFSNWGIVKYDGTGEYNVHIGFEDGSYPKSNESITVVTYIYDDEGKAELKETVSFIWN